MRSEAQRQRRLGLITVLLSLVFVLVLAELGLRLVWTPPSLLSVAAFESHPVYGFAPRPGISGQRVTSEYSHSFSHTGQGWRADHLFTARLPDGYSQRVMFLGDSFTYGLGAENDETFVRLISEDFSAAEFINAGVNGYGQRQQLAVLDQLGSSLKPDVVVLMFFWNDLEDNWENDSPAFEPGDGNRVERTDVSNLQGFDPLEVRQAQRIEMRSAWQTLFLARLIKEGARGIRYRLIGISKRDIRTSADRDEAWRVTARYLEMIKARSSGIGARLIVVSIPDHNKVDPNARIKGIEPLHFDIENRLAEVMNALEIPYLDPLDGMKAAHSSGGKPLYYYADRHLTPAGNEVLAGLISPFLRHFLLPDPEKVRVVQPET